MKFYQDTELKKCLENKQYPNSKIVKIIFDIVNCFPKLVNSQEKQIKILMIVVNGIQTQIDQKLYVKTLLRKSA